MCVPPQVALTIASAGSSFLQFQQAKAQQKAQYEAQKDKMKLQEKMQLEDTQLNN